jgi:hypothetical protein
MFRLALLSTAAMMAVTVTSAPTFAARIDRVEVEQDNDANETRGDVLIETDMTDSVTSAATAQANSAVGAVSNPTELDARQTHSGDVSANSVTDAWAVWGASVGSATAQGNALTVFAQDGLDADIEQRSGGEVSALSALRLDSYAGTTVNTATAASNAVQVTGSGYMPLSIDQQASGGAAARAELDAATAEIEAGVVAAQAAGNSITTAGDESSIVALIDQGNSGDVSAEAVARVDTANWGLTGSAEAAGNTATTYTQWGYGHHQGDQVNTGNVRALAQLDANDFGNGAMVGSAVAYGNNSTLSTLGSDAYSGMNQVNTGDVTGEVLMRGRDGVAMFGSSAAFGNAQTAAICADCPVELIGQSSQYNAGNVVSNTQMFGPGSTGAIAGSATAVGNAMTFATQGGGN